MMRKGTRMSRTADKPTDFGRQYVKRSHDTTTNDNVFSLFNHRKSRDPLRGSNASSEPLLDVDTDKWDHDGMSDLQTPIVLTPASTPPKIHSSTKVYFEADRLVSTRRRSSAKLQMSNTIRRRSRSMSAWSDLSKCSFKHDDR